SAASRSNGADSAGVALLGLGRPSRQHWLGYLLLLPAALLVAALILYPLLVSVGLSVQNVNIPPVRDAPRPWTTANYERLVNSPEFWLSAWITVKFLVVVTSASFAVGLSTALLVNQRFPGRRVARLIVAMPWAVPEVVAVVIFAWIFDSSFGLV